LFFDIQQTTFINIVVLMHELFFNKMHQAIAKLYNNDNKM